jgi:hypothetical protein
MDNLGDDIFTDEEVRILNSMVSKQDLLDELDSRDNKKRKF